MSWIYYGKAITALNGKTVPIIGTLSGCCGVGEMRGFLKGVAPSAPSYYRPISDLEYGPYTGIFVCTYTRHQQKEGLEEELNKYHTLQYQSEFLINTGPHATEHGREGGVRTAVYKWGK